MLEHNFFTIKQVDRNGNAFAANIKINKTHPVFEGHFPEHPVVPGVFTLQVIKECASFVLGKNLQYTELQNCKFSSIIVPDDNSITIEFEYIEGEPAILKAAVKDEDVVCLTLKAKVREITV